VPAFPLGRVAGAAARGGLEIPHDPQQFQIVLLVHTKTRPSKVRNVVTPPDPWRPLDRFPVGVDCSLKDLVRHSFLYFRSLAENNDLGVLRDTIPQSFQCWFSFLFGRTQQKTDQMRAEDPVEKIHAYSTNSSAIRKRFTHGRPQKFFQGGQSRHFAYLFLVVGDATQIDVDKKENIQCYGNSCMPCKKTLYWANVCFSEHGYIKTELAEF